VGLSICGLASHNLAAAKALDMMPRYPKGYFRQHKFPALTTAACVHLLKEVLIAADKR
jgi:hypothetical protein